MKAFVLNLTFSFSLVLLIQNSLAHNTGTIIDGNILKGIIDPIDVNQKIGQVILDALSENPEHVSQIDADSGEQITYKEMKDRSIRLALWMKSLGVGPNDIIVHCSHNQMDSYLPFIATFFVDSIFSGWSANIQVEKARLFIQQYTPKVIFASEKTVDTLLEAAKLENSNVKIIVLGKHSSLQSLTDIINSQTKDDVESFRPVNKKTPQEAAAILLTSGTTGTPKGVVYSSQSLVAKALIYRTVYSDLGIVHENGITHLCYTDLSTVSGLWCSLDTLVQKNIKVVATVLDENEYFKAIEQYKVNVAQMPISLIQPIINSKTTDKYNIQTLQTVTLHGAKFGSDVLIGLRQKLPNVFVQYLFGTTEAGASIALRTRKAKEVESVGFVVPNGQVKFVDLKSNKTLGPNQQGEIYAKTSTMMIGYYKNPEATQKVFDSQGWLHTGDLGYYNENGEIFVVGRKD